VLPARTAGVRPGEAHPHRVRRPPRARAAGFESPAAGLPSQGAARLRSRAVEAVAEADRILAELQDSMLPVEAGDEELRAGLKAFGSL
jgi:hypothetical protein